MRFSAVGAKTVSVAAKLAGLLFIVVLIAQVVPGGPVEWFFGRMPEWAPADEEPPFGPIR